MTIEENASLQRDTPDWPGLNNKKTSCVYRFVRWLIWLFTPKYRIIGREKLPEGPCVIVGNHSQIYGPVEAELYTPGKHDTWCIGQMMHREEIPAYAFQDFWSEKPALLRPFFRLMSHLIVPLSLLLFQNAHTIPVYHDSRLITTYRKSVESLQAGSKVVIFPEHYQEHNHIVHDFQDKFVDLARFYFRKTGESISFVPMYIAPRLKTVVYGEAIRFYPEKSIAEERSRICCALMDSITDLAESLPEHTVIPYPNIPKRLYPKNTIQRSTSDEKASI